MSSLEQFDPSIRGLAAYTHALSWADLTPRVTEALVSHTIDTIACGFGALSSDVGRAMRSLAGSVAVTGGASAMGVAARTTTEYAALANGALVRFLDFNDTYITKGGGHPSDLIPALLAVAEREGSSGREFLVAMHGAYEIVAVISDVVQVYHEGWDYSLLIGIAAAAGVAKLMKQDAAGIANAIAIAATSGVPLGVTRVGPLSEWKGMAGPAAAMSAIVAGELARRGITGPPHAFEGHNGLFEQVTGAIDLSAVGRLQDGLSAVERTGYKLAVAGYLGQAPIGDFVMLHREGVRPEQVARVRIRAYEFACRMLGGGQGDRDEKWNPRTRETADHSLPYMLAVALADGRVDDASYAPERIADPRLLEFMAKITVEPDEAITRSGEPAFEIEVTLADGSRRDLRSVYHRGHHRNPATRDDILEKFHSQARGVAGEEQCKHVLRCLEALPAGAALAELGDALRAVGGH